MKILSKDDFLRSNAALMGSIILSILLSGTILFSLWVYQQKNTQIPQVSYSFTRLREAEADLDLKTLSLQLGLAQNYDYVSRAVGRVNDCLATLQGLVASDKGLSGLREKVDKYNVAISGKIKRIEQLKASFSVLKNAVNMLPSVVSDVFEQERLIDQQSGNAERPSELLTRTMTSVMGLMVSPTENLRSMVTRDIDRTRDAARTQPETMSLLLNRFLDQAEVAIRERRRNTTLMLAIVSGLTNDAQLGIETELRAMEATDALGRQRLVITAAFSALLLALTLSTLALVIRGRLVKLDQDNHTLHLANQDVEEQLVQSAKLSALGQMVAGITHEINTPLAYVKAIFELIRGRLSENDQLLESLAEARSTSDEEAREQREELQTLLDDGIHGLEEISTLVRSMKNFSRLDKNQNEIFSVEEGLESVLLIARSKLKYVADVERDFGSVPDILGSPSQLRQVFLNLIVNAVQAIALTEKRGVLKLRTRVSNENTVQIDIRDNGPGIPDDVMPRIFDPFFTTKPVGEGTGMGLSICYKIVENHGGMISVVTSPGAGTTFTVRLPLNPAKVASVKSGAKKPLQALAAE